MTSPEDRLAGALNDRAAAARTSPDALDGVFRKVATHRRRTRAVAGASLAVALVAGTVVASAAVRQPGADSLQPTQPGPTSSATPQDEPSTPEPSTSPSPAPSTSAAPSTPPGTYPKDSAVVLLADHRVAVVSTTTGEELDSLGTLPSDAEPSGENGYRLAWSRANRAVYFGRSGCRIGVLDANTGVVSTMGSGRNPALSPDGMRLAAVACDREPEGNYGNGIVVTDFATKTVTSYRGVAPWPEGGAPSLARELDWLDETRLAVAVAWETPEGVIVLDTTKDKTLDDGTWLKIGVENPVVNGDELLGLERCCYPEGEKPPNVVRWRLADKEPETVVTLGAGPVLDLDIDAAGRVLILRQDGLWRWDRESAPKLVRRGATALGG